MTREEAIKWIEDITLSICDGFNRHMYQEEKLEALDMAIEALQSEPVKHGEWVEDDTIQHKYFRCSNCGIGQFNWGEDNYCRNCGAKMKGQGK